MSSFFWIALKLILGRVQDEFCAMFMADLWSQLGRVCCRVKELFPRRVWVGK